MLLVLLAAEGLTIPFIHRLLTAHVVIGMVLVPPEKRRMGIGTALLMHGIEYLEAKGVAAVKLDATPLGRPLYEKLGFVVEYDLALKQRCPGTFPISLANGELQGYIPTPEATGAGFSSRPNAKMARPQAAARSRLAFKSRLLLAPTICSATWPFLMTNNVGMAVTLNCAARP